MPRPKSVNLEDVISEWNKNRKKYEEMPIKTGVAGEFGGCVRDNRPLLSKKNNHGKQ